MKALLTEPVIMRERGSGTRRSIEQVLDKSGHWLKQLNVAAEMGSTEAVRQGVKAGVGVSIVSECAVADELAAGSLSKVRIDNLVLKRAFYLIVHKHRTQSPLCRAFIEFLKEQVKSKASRGRKR